MAVKTPLRIHLWGAAFILVLGTILHFSFDWLGQWKPAALISAVNESVWEHLKLVFWPAFIFSLIEYSRLKNNPAFFKAKAASFVTMPTFILVIFYAYTGIWGHHILFVDISLFVVAVLAGQWVSYRVIQSGVSTHTAKVVAIAVILVLLLAFSLFTFYPPNLPVFQDPLTGGYGM